MVREDFEKITNAPPDYSTSNVTTTVTVPDGSTIILGGLTKLNQTKGGSKVPLLGDLPLVGGLFRSVSNSDEASKLYIFVKANVLRPHETVAGLPELERISDRNRAAFERFEEKFQKLEDWPGIKPEPMDPLRILDAE
jgi:general secretion pathway protein D